MFRGSLVWIILACPLWRATRPGAADGNRARRVTLWLHAHAADGIAPVAVTGGSADGADFDDVRRAGRQAGEDDCPGVGEHAAALPRAGCAAGTDEGKPGFISAGIGSPGVES